MWAWAVDFSPHGGGHTCKDYNSECYVRTVYSMKSSLLRNKPKRIAHDDVVNMIKNYDFYDIDVNQKGQNFTQTYQVKTIQGDKIVLNKSLGLMWEIGGSKDTISYKNVKRFIKEFNQKRYAGFCDWRLPTLEESMSLIKPQQDDEDLFIDKVFDEWQDDIWTSDTLNGIYNIWVVDFKFCNCHYSTLLAKIYVRATRSINSLVDK